MNLIVKPDLVRQALLRPKTPRTFIGNIRILDASDGVETHNPKWVNVSPIKQMNSSQRRAAKPIDLKHLYDEWHTTQEFACDVNILEPRAILRETAPQS
mmetsp:Transcript_2246/g.8286  ORF Transcript_2246/g.8286 Transcript_2246/m.8286 type:complete len:99 (+) Transcript_2246:388-684(+)